MRRQEDPPDGGAGADPQEHVLHQEHVQQPPGGVCACVCGTFMSAPVVLSVPVDGQGKLNV